MPTRTEPNNLERLEQQLATNDFKELISAMEESQKALTSEIDHSRKLFSDEIRKSLNTMRESIENAIPQEIERVLPGLFRQGFQNFQQKAVSNLAASITASLDKLKPLHQPLCSRCGR